MDDGIAELSPEAVIRAGGWHPQFARALLIEHDGDLGLVLMDGNGDGAELEIEYWMRATDGLWYGGSSSGHGSLATLASADSWNAGDFVAAVGRVKPGAEVSVGYGGQIYARRANEHGIWGFIHVADSARTDDLPAVTAVTAVGLPEVGRPVGRPDDRPT